VHSLCWLNDGTLPQNMTENEWNLLQCKVCVCLFAFCNRLCQIATACRHRRYARFRLFEKVVSSCHIRFPGEQHHQKTVHHLEKSQFNETPALEVVRSAISFIAKIVVSEITGLTIAVRGIRTTNHFHTLLDSMHVPAYRLFHLAAEMIFGPIAAHQFRSRLPDSPTTTLYCRAVFNHLLLHRS